MKIGGVEYGVKFQVTGTYDANLSASTIKSNTDIKNNYIKIVSSDIDVSGMDQVGINPGANTGVFLLSDISGANTQTEGHEFGHGLAAVSGTLDGHPDFFDQRGHGQPGIMYPKGTPVDAPYTYDPSKGASSLDKKTGKVTNAMNPSKRKANQEDINYLNIDKLKFDTKGKAQLGKLTNTVH